MGTEPPTPADDPYSRVDYRRLIAWPRRIRREWPLLRRVLESAPAHEVLDLGCGTGEHARFLHGHGFRVLGVDASESMLAAAREAAPPADGLEFLAGKIQEIGRLTDRLFGAAICLGNTLPHLEARSDLGGLFAGLARRLRPGAPLLLQLLNYQRIFDRHERHLPLNFVDDTDGTETVFLRLMTPQPDGAVLFFPTTLRLDPDSDSPLEVVRSTRVRLRGWTASEVEEELIRAGFDEIRLIGGFDEEAFLPTESRDLLVLARRETLGEDLL